MTLTVNVKPDATSRAQETKRTAKAQRQERTEWYCSCVESGGLKRNSRYLNNCPYCGMRREQGARG